MEVCIAVPRADGSFLFEDVQLIRSLPALAVDHLALLDGPVTVTLTSHNPNGSGHHSPVWLGRDDSSLYLSSIRGRLDDRNLRARPDVALLLIDPADPYRRLTISGVVSQVIDDDLHSNLTTELINQLGTPASMGAFHPTDLSRTENRVLYRIQPRRSCCTGVIVISR